MKQQLIDRLHAEGCSCVIYNNDHTHLFHKRGVQDMHQLLRTSPDTLCGAMIADKVVGKGAAVLMTAGGVRWVYADVSSQSALEFLLTHNIEAEYGRVVPNIINRAGTDICPVEKVCMQCDNIEDALTLIDEFIEKMRRAG